MLGRCSIFGLRFSLVGVIFSCLEFFFIVIYQNYVQATLFVHIELRLSFRTADELHCKILYLLYLVLALNYVFHSALVISCIAESSYIWRLCWTTSFILHCQWAALQKNLYLSLVLNYVFHSALPMSSIAKYLLYLALVLNYIFHYGLPKRCIAKIPLIFDACFARSLLFVTFHVVNCNAPIPFGACVELRIFFRTFDIYCSTTPICFSFDLCFVYWAYYCALRLFVLVMFAAVHSRTSIFYSSVLWHFCCLVPLLFGTSVIWRRRRRTLLDFTHDLLNGRVAYILPSSMAKALLELFCHLNCIPPLPTYNI